MIIDATRDCHNCYCHLVCAIYNPYFDNYAPECNLYMGKGDYEKVVRCKNCIWYKPYEKPVEDFDGWCSARSCETDDEEFCSYGSNGL